MPSCFRLNKVSGNILGLAIRATYTFKCREDDEARRVYCLTLFMKEKMAMTDEQTIIAVAGYSP